MKVEPASLAAHPLTPTGISIAFAQRLFNATLDIQDGSEHTHPYLAESLPQLNSESWKVQPDGTMETTWRLRPNITWHDGTPLTAADFVFGWKVYATPDLGQASSPPISLMDEVAAPDARTVVIRWKRIYPEAAALGSDFQALPRHVLQSDFDDGDMVAFANHPFWTAQYLGLGPYRLDRWEPGAEIQATAFEGHVLGQPKIDRVVVRFVPDENTALTNLLSGNVQFATDRTIRFEQAQVLRQQWGTTGGTAILTPAQPRFLALQQRPDLANPRIMTDVRARRAVAHAIDRQALNEGLFTGQGAPTETLITPYFSAYQDVQRAIATYPFDPRQVEQLLGELGYTKGSDGALSNADGRLNLGYLQEVGDQTQREMAIIVDAWRQAGIEAQVTAMASSQLRDYQIRGSYPSVYASAMGGAVKGGTKNLANFTSSQVGTPANRWRGANYSGWANADYDRLYDQFTSTLDQTTRDQQVVQMARLISDEVAFIPLFFNFNVSAHSSALTGPDPKAFDTLVDWNVHEWRMD
jgi:peptide/nickel transport system substrate-binding protein